MSVHNVYICARDSNGSYIVDIESYLILNIVNICKSDLICVNLVLTDTIDDAYFKVNLVGMNAKISNDIPTIASYCKWPVIVTEHRVVAGLCSVMRQIIKSSKNEEVYKLLGFREACLVACSESSIWTKFCEVDFVQMIKQVITKQDQTLLTNLTRFEYHMQQPIKMHNLYKFARIKNNDKEIKSSTAVEDLNIDHTFSEGAFITLSDVILFPCLKILTDIFDTDLLLNFPLISKWFAIMQIQNIPFLNAIVNFKMSLEVFDHSHVPRQSLYISDPNRYRPQSRIYTKQQDIDKSLLQLYESNIEIKNDVKPFGSDIEIKWSEIPMELNPSGGALPKKRAARKTEQLENLAKAVIKIATDKQRIVDFCSGSGHLGLLLAACLPKCTIILVENKEKSLERAEERIIKLNLGNVVILQTNLDYFGADFDIGVALHACGVATDLVLTACIKHSAHFVICPCCYGGIHECHHITYPLSKIFKEALPYSDYLHIAHAADQTHDSKNAKTRQGYLCMNIIDTDRKLFAEEANYEVHLGKLQPTDCTPKNNLLVGLCMRG